MADFVKSWLGLAWNLEGSSITERMLEQASRGEGAGAPPNRFIPGSQLIWKAA